MRTPTFAVVLDTRRALKDGTFPVKLRATYDRKQRYYPTAWTLTEADYGRVTGAKPRKPWKQTAADFHALEVKARAAADLLPAFTFESFERKLFNAYDGADALGTLERIAARFSEEGRAGTATGYRTAAKSLRTYAMSTAGRSRYRGLPFESVTADWLHSYERWMLDAGRSPTTVSMYTRCLRTAFNEAIAEGDVPAERYPFGKRKYQPPAGRSVKKALTVEEIGRIFRYEPRNEREARAVDLWKFSYLTGGINFKDICRLRWGNVEEDAVTFVRAKTERTHRTGPQSITAALTDEAREIIERWGVTPRLPDAYVFGLLTPDLTAEAELARTRDIIKQTNSHMKRVAAACGIAKNVTTYSARHS
ncbi:MAG: site-specific integrase, partial [Catalinimonas sp.]